MNDGMKSKLRRAIETELSKWTEPHVVSNEPDAVSDIEQAEDVDVPEVVTSPAAINNGWCKVFAERVYDRLGQPDGVAVESDGVRHTWLEYDGLCYDAQCHEGVPHPSMLPAYQEQ